MNRIPHSSPSNLRIFTACLLSFMILIAPIASVSAAIRSERPNVQPEKAQASAPITTVEPPSASPGLFSMLFAPAVGPITAVKLDSIADANGDGKADLGETITYAVTIQNTGTDAATNLAFSDPIDENTSFVAGSLNVSPLAFNDAYDTIGNTLLEVGVTASTDPVVRVTGDVFDNDVEFLGDTFTFDVITDNVDSGTLTFNTNGTFTYLPNADFSGTDAFTYRIKDAGGLTSTATVTINVVNKVWYVKNNAAAGGNGRSSAPFDTLLEAETASDVGETIYVFNGTGTTIGQDAGITLKANQRLIGEGVELNVPVSVNGGPNPTVLNDAGTKPMIDHTGGGNGVSVTNIAGVEIRGLNIAGDANALDVMTSGASTGGFEFADNTIRSSGGEGVDVNHGSTGTMAVSIHDNTITAGTHGIEILRLSGAGSVNVTAFDDNTVTGTTGLIGINIVAAGTGTVLFDTNPGTPAFDVVSGGTTTIGSSGLNNGAGTAGMVLNNVRGDLSFTDLDIYADSGNALLLIGTTPNYTGTTGTRVTANTNTPTLSATGGAALSVTDAAINIQSTTLTSNTSSASGVSLTRVSGTLSATSGSITNASAADFFIDGDGNANANVSVTYPGTITDDGGSLVQILDVTATSTHAFSGAITDNEDGDGTEQGISLTSNSGATITFSGGVLIRTTTQPAFTATGGGTINVCNDNPCDPANGSVVNRLTTTTGTALNVASTNIGANKLEFQRISAGTGASGPANGIILNATGATGGLTITGTGSAGTGGTIQNTTADGISLTSTRNINLSRMIVNSGDEDGIDGTSVVGFTMADSSVTNNGNVANEEGLSFSNLSGAVSLTNITATGNAYQNLRIDNTTGTISSLTITGGSYSNNSATTGNHGILIEPRGTSQITTADITGVTIHDNLVMGIQVATADTANVTDFEINGCTITNNELGIDFSKAQTSNLQFKIINNTTFTGQNSHGINLFTAVGAGTTGNFQGRITGNTIGNAGVASSGSAIGNCVRVNINGDANADVLIDGNTIRQCPNGRGIEVIGRNGTGGLDVTVTNNNVSHNPVVTQELAAIFVQSNCVGVCNTVRSDVRGNTVPVGVATFELLPTYIALLETSGAPAPPGTSTLQLVDTAPPSATCTDQLTSTNTGSASASAGCALIAGPINTPPLLFAQGGIEAATGLQALFMPTTGISSTMPLLETLLNHDISPAIVNDGTLSDAELRVIADAAIARWAATGLTANQISVLRNLKFNVADLGGSHIADVAGNQIRLDRDAGGYRWFVDATPMDDVEFGDAISGSRLYTGAAGAPAGRIDLLTAIMHEIGHYLNLSDSYTTQFRDNLMYGYLTKGERRLPLADQAGGAIPGASAGRHFLSVRPESDRPSRRVAKAQAKRSASPPAAKALATTAPLMPSHHTVNVAIGTLPGNNKSVTITFQVQVNASVPTSVTQISNQGQVTGDGGISVLTDADPSNGTPNEPTTTPLARADLALTSKTDGVTTITPGGDLTYVISYENHGRAASNAVLTESVPTGTTFKSAGSSAGWSCPDGSAAGTSCTLTIGAIPSTGLGSTGSRTFVVTVVNPAAAGLNSISNTASIADTVVYEADITPLDNSAIDNNTTLNAAPTFTISKADGATTTTTPGSTLIYTINYSNSGNQNATGVVLTETVPAGTTFESTGSSTWTGCADGAAAGTVCTISVGALAGAGTGSGTETFAVTVLSPAAAGLHDIVNTVGIDDDGTNSVADVSNSAIDSDTLNAAPDLTISKTPDVTNTAPGQTIVYTLTYSNTGTQGATGVEITETVPTDTTFDATASSPTVWSCADNSAAGTTCKTTIGALAGNGGTGTAKKFAVKVIAAPAGTTVSNTATIGDDTTNGADQTPADNTTGSVNTPIDTPPTLGNYANTTALVSETLTVTPSVGPADDNAGFDLDVTISAGFTGTVAVDDTTGVVTITNAGPASGTAYTVTITVTDSINQTVVKTFDLTVNKSDTTTALTSAPNPSFTNQQVTFEATVASSTTITSTPTGSVDFFDGATLICDDRPLDGTGKATCQISTLTGPSHNITATYNGDDTDGRFLTSTSSILVQTINPALSLLVNMSSDEPDANVGDGLCDTDTGTAGDQCTLRAAIQETNDVPSADTIGFDASLVNGTITLDTALDAIDDNLVINGLDANLLTVERNNAAATDFRIFSINASKTVTISGLTISGGEETFGGGIRNAGTLTVNDCAISGNTATSSGGGIVNFSTGTLTINGSTISGNDSDGTGGGIGNDGTLVITNTTISGNHADGNGGGLQTTGASVTVTNATITDNRADFDNDGNGDGGGVFRGSGTVRLRNTIVAVNYNDPSPSVIADDVNGALDTATSFNNLIGDGTGMTGVTHNNNGNKVGTSISPINPLLDVLDNYGGATETHALLSNSPAMDAGSNPIAIGASLTTDQRGAGFNRLADSAIDGDATLTTDIGAFEAQPSIVNIPNKGTNEDTALPGFNFLISGGAAVGITVTATSSDQTLVPDANLVLSVPGLGAVRRLDITPAADQHGTATITVTVSGMIGSTNVSQTDTFVLTVNPVADTPSVGDATTTEDTQTGLIPIAKNANDGAEVTHFLVTGMTGGQLYYADGTTPIPNNSFVQFSDVIVPGGVKFTPAPDFVGTGGFTIRAATGNLHAALGGGTDTSIITVNADNDLPTLNAISDRTVLEDSGTHALLLSGITAGAGESQSLQVTATSDTPSLIPDPVVTYSSPDQTGTLNFTPVANAFGGPVTITVTVTETSGGSETFSRTFDINVTGVNDAPTFTMGPNQSVDEDAPTQTIPNWATGISMGPGESTQTPTFLVTTTSTGLFSEQPAVSPTGTLTFKPLANTTGVANVFVRLQDSGGTDNGGQDLSPAPVLSFTITVSGINDEPSFTPGANQEVLEDAGPQTVNNWATSISAGNGEGDQTYAFTVTNDNNGLFSAQPVINAAGTLSYTPAVDASGLATVSVVFKDNGGTAGGGDDTFATQTFTITVKPVNDAPTIGITATRIIAEDSDETVGIWIISAGGGESQTLTVTATSSNTSIIPDPVVTYTSPNHSGTIKFQPVPNAVGTAIITVTVTDNGGIDDGGVNTSSDTLDVTVTEVNDAPVAVNDTLSNMLEDAAPRQILFAALFGNDSKGPANESAQTLTVHAVSEPVGGTVAIVSGKVVFTPTPNYNGPASFNYKVRDNGKTNGVPDPKIGNATCNFTITAVNDAPVNTVPGAQTVVQNGTLTFSTGNSNRITIADVDAAPGEPRVTLSATHGKLTLGSKTGLTFTVNDGTSDQTMTFTGTIANINTALNGTVFAPDANYTGPATVQITTNDRGFNGSGGSKSDADSISIDVTAAFAAAKETAAKAKSGSRSVVELSDASYSVKEDELRAAITVRRTGDLSSPAIVNYATNDAAGMTPCVVAEGNASSRCDYARGAGKLSFAAGESERTILIPVVNDAHAEGPESFSLTLTGAEGARVGPSAETRISIVDNDHGGAAPNPVDTDEFFIRQLYIDLLGREPEAEGLAAWLKVLDECRPQGCDRTAVVMGFVRSDEFSSRGYFVYRLYSKGLGRAPLYEEFTRDVARLSGPLDAQALAQAKRALAEELASSAEFKARNESLTATVRGGNLRAEALREQADAAEGAGARQSGYHPDEAFLVLSYFALLRRDPDALLQNWVEMLKHSGDYRAVITGFINSPEYRQRFAP